MSSSVWAVERVAVLLTPLFGALAAWLVALAANNVPGSPRLSATDLTTVMLAAFIGTTSLALKWLHGRQKPALITAPIDPKGVPPSAPGVVAAAEVSPVAR
jgi:hypothetical protein